MKNPSHFPTSLLVASLASGLVTLSCAGGETATGSGSGGSSSGTGGRASTGSGGSSFGSGGSTTPGTGGRVGTGGSTSGTGGSSFGTGGSSFGTGGSSFGTGGSSFGTGGSGAPGSGGSPVSTGALTVAAGYVTSGTWKGYGYTFTGPTAPKTSTATIAPATFMTATQLCSMGMITADTTYESVAGMGFNVNQEIATTATPPATNTVATTGAGLLVNVGTVTGLTLAPGSGSQLRAQVKTATGDYCAPIPAMGAQMIPWAMFNSKCWNTAEAGAAAFTAGTAIKAVELVIPSTAAAIVGPFNMCLVDARPY